MNGLRLESLFFDYRKTTTTIRITTITTITNHKLPLRPVAYSLGSTHVLQIMDLIYKDTLQSLFVNPEKYLSKDISTQLKILEDTMQVLDSSVGKGYINSLNLAQLPLIKDLLPAFIINYQEESIEYINGEKSMESYKWMYAIIILTLYYLCLSSIEQIEKVETEDVDVDVDVLTALKITEGNLWGRLDSSIKHHIRKPGVSLSKNIYVGFDTEFNNISSGKNKLVSSQIAVSSRVIAKVPKTPRYSISSFDVDLNKLHRVKTKSDIFNYSKVETSIQILIQQIKYIKFGRFEECMLILTECLKQIKGLKYYDIEEEYTLFSFPKSEIQPYIYLGKQCSFKTLLDLASPCGNRQVDAMSKNIVELLVNISQQKLSAINGKDQLLAMIHEIYKDYTEFESMENMGGKILPLVSQSRKSKSKSEVEKRLTREFLPDFYDEGHKICITSTKRYYLLAHLSQADLSMLSDFEDIKEGLNIVNGSFVTIRDPLSINGRSIHIRDTMLLAPGGSRSLASIGRLYGEGFEKIKISKQELEDMESFLANDPDKFVEYAVRDALISLVHGMWMEEFNFKSGGVGIPVSLSSIGRKFVKSVWKELKYPGYQVSNKYSLGNVSSTITPKGLNVVKDIGYVLPYYIANYKGGRNECFMYGIDRETVWFDYDLSSAYTTVMALIGQPDYAKYRKITLNDLNKLSREEILYSYIIISTEFEFPRETKYPSIPCYVDANSTIYPLQGQAVLTGAEYLLAQSQCCKLKVKEIHYLPFHQSEFADLKPFGAIVQIVQDKRREYAKGTISNLMYKEIGNGIYGSVVRGISDKKKYDTKSKTTQRLTGDELSNPLIASWTTAFIRSIIGECLDSIHKLDGLVVSVTTDGFITNVSDLDSKISNNYLFSEYKKIRKILSEDTYGLELKHQGKGIIAWSTRGQLGLESKIIATTGFQHFYPREEMIQVFSETMKTESKTIEFIMSRLRSASEVFKKGGQVTMEYKDQQFRMHFDNKRVIEVPSELGIGIGGEFLFDSRPLENVTHGENLRFIGKLTKVKQYTRYSGKGNVVRYNKLEDLAINNFVKGLQTNPPLFNLNRVVLKKNKDIIEFLKGYNPEIKLTENSIAVLKYRNIKWRSVPRIQQTEAFVKYVLTSFKDFDVDSFFRTK